MPLYVHPYDSNYDTLVSSLSSTTCPGAFQARGNRRSVGPPTSEKGPVERARQRGSVATLTHASTCASQPPRPPARAQATVLTGPRSGPPNSSEASEDSLFRPRFAAVAGTNSTLVLGYVYTQ